MEGKVETVTHIFCKRIGGDDNPVRIDNPVSLNNILDELQECIDLKNTCMITIEAKSKQKYINLFVVR